MVYRVLADLVLVLHLAFILLAVAGGLLALRWRWVPFVQLPAALWGVFIEISGGVCPLTPIENRLRQATGDAGYEGGFIEHYLLPILYPEGLTGGVQWALAGIVVISNLAIYLLVWRRSR